MEAQKDISAKSNHEEAVKPRPTISRERWTSRMTHPKLVHFSWGSVSPMNSQR